MGNIIGRIKFYPRHYGYLLRKNLGAKMRMCAHYIQHNLLGKHVLTDTEIYNIPIIINNFNRLDCLKKVIDRYVSSGYKNIVIIDNASSYPPLLEYYQSCPYTLHRLKKNMEFPALWVSGLYDQIYRHGYYVYTDPDILPDAGCPDDFVHHFYRLLSKYPSLDKMGFSLRIDNLPDHYDPKQAVLQNEAPYWRTQRGNAYFEAPIDTTFALYRPGRRGTVDLKAGRSIPPYTALHLPWYSDSNHPDEETIYYRSQALYSKNWT
jgi:hypothetical protein